jgi:rRNA maturation RNase YbeY
MTTPISIFTTIKGARLPRAKLTRLAKIVLTGRHPRKPVNLIFVADGKMRRLNRDYRRHDRTTDVLSFNLEDENDPLLGEIYISLPQARRNAERYGATVSEEILRLFCHGLLHLCGIHHPDTPARERVSKMVEGYLAQLDHEVKK